MKYFLKFIILILFSGSSYAQHFYHIPQQNIKVDHDNNDILWTYDTKKSREIQTPDMMISNFINLQEYKIFLNSVKENIHDTLYKKLVPNSCLFKEGNFDKYYTDPSYEKYPVIGISQEDALEYCKWKTLEGNIGDSISFIYTLPTREEWFSAYYFLENANVMHDFNKLLSDMTMTVLNISTYSFTNDLNPDYSYQDTDTDLPYLKRKMVMGKSYLFRNNGMETTGQQFYSYEDLPFSGFRIIKKKVYRSQQNNFSNNKFDFRTPDHQLLKKWGFENKIAYDNKDVLVPAFNYHKRKQLKSKKYGELTGISIRGSIKSSGCMKGDKPYGDWYQYDKNGFFKEHVYYDNHDVKLIKNDLLSYTLPIAPKIEEYTFINDLVKSKNEKSTLVSEKDFVYEMENKRLNGFFIFSENNFTVAGKFTDNMRFGKWCMWDDSEKLILVREYNTDHEFKTIYPNYRSHQLTNLTKDHPYSLKRNKDGYYDYFKIKENAVVWSKSILRRLNIEDNPILFKDFDFFDFLMNKQREGYFNPLEAKNQNEFYRPITLEETLEKFNSETDELVAYVLKEVIAYDIERFDTERRIIGICPVFKNKNTQEEREVFWIYLPDLRKEAAKVKLSAEYLPNHIKTLDDVFFFRYYGGKIIGESNVYSNRRYSEYLDGIDIEIEAQRTQKVIFNTEFNLWKLFNTDAQKPE